MIRREWLIVGVLAMGLAGLLVWAWADGGERPLSALSEPVTIPGASS